MLHRAKKSYGQNFLNDMSVVKKIIDEADIKKGEIVLEIGPGKGVLTQALVEAGAKVIAIEADRDLINPLQEKFGNKIELIFGDALQNFGRHKWRPYLITPPLHHFKYKLVANIPYNITSAILEKFLTNKPKPSHMVIMVQREVADRIVAKPPNMSLLSVVCQMYGECRKVVKVPAGAFRPIPKVDSAVVHIDLFQKNENRFLLKTKKGFEENVIALAKAGFAHKRKQLHGNLQSAGKGSSKEIKEILKNLGFSEFIRAQELTVENWIELYFAQTRVHKGQS
ncbi:MAG: 16S rRNA (adenine(1518)-N(6)/adenine(1519)-N(6))-dimethyltransferase RsmA [Patescibacteria group bacterium]